MAPPLQQIVESILLVAEDPVEAAIIAEVVERPRTEIEGLLEELARAYRDEDRGYVLKETALGWRLYTHPDCADWLERFVQRGRHARLSAAALEVLSVIAYRQPISRAQIAEIRGIDSDRIVKSLIQKGLVEETGAGAAGAALLQVTAAFLERVGLRSVADLPPLTEFMPDADAIEEMESRLSPEA